MNIPSPLAPLPRFEEGSSMTPFSAKVMNALIDRIDLISNIIGRNGIKVFTSDSNIVIDGSGITGSAAPAEDEDEEQEPTSLQWQGQYYNENAYVEGDIVRRNLPEEYEQGSLCGTYIALRDVPAGGVEPTQAGSAFWDVFSPLPTDHFVFGSPDSRALTITTRTTGRVFIQENASIPTAPYVDIDTADARQKQISLNVINTCEDGESGTRVILESDTRLS